MKRGNEMTKRAKSWLIVGIVGMALLSLLLAYIFYHFIAFLCGGYNSIMYKHLSNANNYESIELTYESAYYYGPDSHDRIDVDGNTVPNDYGIYLEGHIVTDDGEQLKICFELFKSNAEVLIKSGFFDDVSEGDVIKIRATQWWYMDNDFNFVAEVEYEDKLYLELDQGLKNIIAVMNKHRIPLA